MFAINLVFSALKSMQKTFFYNIDEVIQSMNVFPALQDALEREKKVDSS
jgi:hypothetical protein